MSLETKTKNWVIGDNFEVFSSIHQEDINIVINERDTSSLESELELLIQRDFEFRFSGTVEDITREISEEPELVGTPLVVEDLQKLLHSFKEVSESSEFRLYFATVSSNMCRKFHTDINDLRMLCTYKGRGTLWLTEDNVSREAEEDESLVLDRDHIQEAKEGSVLILKGAIYPKEGTRPVLHRSPSIEESRGKRILLRIDTTKFLNY
ncbi:MAG: DUF1826 domain-containing protein [Ekhidna sp.]|nr:DUF1826 domain-containing protein [Ekhidna sp.]